MSRLSTATQGHRLVNESNLTLAPFLLSIPVHSARAPSRLNAPYKCDLLAAESAVRRGWTGFRELRGRRDSGRCPHHD